MVVRAGLRYRKEGLNPPAKVVAAGADYRRDMDLLGEWLDECCDIAPEKSCKVSDLWDSWETYARRRGLINYIRSSKALGRRLDGRFLTGKGAKGVRIRHGIALRAADDLF